MVLLKYNLEDINNIIYNGFDFNIPENTKILIKYLNDEIIKTNNISAENKIYKEKSFKKNRKNENKNNQDWSTIRTFQITKIEQKTGIDLDIDKIRLYLNKITYKTLDNNKEKIINIIDKLISDNLIDNYKDKISSLIFNTLSINIFYSKLYSNLYCDLLVKYNWLENNLHNSYNNYFNKILNIEYIDPNIDYDKFCENNKNNENNKALALFFVNLCSNKILSYSNIILLIKNILELIIININDETKKYNIEFWIEILFNLYNKELYNITISKNSYINNNEFILNGVSLFENIKIISSYEPKIYKGLSNKSIFKLYDILGL